MTDDPKTGLPLGVTPGAWWTDARYSGAEMGCSIIAARTDCGPLPGNPTRGQVAFATAVLNTDARKAEANARLIAAAPDLYRALVTLRSWVVDEVGADLPCESIDAALAAARGETGPAGGGEG